MKTKLYALHWLPRLALAATVCLIFAPPAEAAGFRLLHSFCKKIQCADGQFPTERLTLDEAGDIYGTASSGTHAQGIVFKLTAPTDGGAWKYKVLYNFCAKANCSDGRDPTASTLIVDTAGNVYGTTFGGGAGNDTGTVFELSPG